MKHIRLSQTDKYLYEVLSLLVIFILSVSALVVPVYAQQQQQSYQPPHQNPGPATDQIQFKSFTVDIAPTAIQGNQMDFYAFALRTSAAKGLLVRSDIRAYRAPASTISIILNPAPAPSGDLNPFSIREVRYAMQYLVNRDFISSGIYQGLAVPMITHISPFDYDYLTLYDLTKSMNIHYDSDYAKSIIDSAMTKAGAAKDTQGRWTFNGKPIQLKFIIRTEDERRDIGDTVASELDKLGFTVNRQYMQFAPAIQAVYSSDPRVFQWNMYTEGWSKGSLQKYDFATLNQMAAPWFGNMPGWQESGFYQYQNSTLDDLTKRIFTGDFKDLNERDSLYRQATLAEVQESIRIWVVNTVNTYPAGPSLKGVTGDLAGGPTSMYTLREAYIPGKSTLTVGNVWVWTQRTIWNPVGGFGDVYSTNIWQYVHDTPLSTNPFSGDPIPFRTTFNVSTAGSDGKLNIPSDAFTWDASSGQWKNAAAGSQAKSKVIFDFSKYVGANWQHGQPITMADIIYNLYQTFDNTYNPSKSKIEFASATVNKPYLDTFKGFRIIGDNKLEVYVDYWHFIPDYIAQYAEPVSLSMPWEINAAMDNLVFTQRKAAYSDTAAEKFQVPWLSLIMDKDARLVRNTLLDFSRNNFVPTNALTVNGKSLVSPADAQKRYNASTAWFDKYDNMVISNGPYILAKFDPTSQYAQLDAFRDPTYPFKPGDWYFGEAQTIDISNVQGGPLAVGSDAKYSVQVSGPGQLGLKYILFDPVKGQILTSGDASKTSSSQLDVNIPSSVTSKLVTGSPYNLYLAAYSDKIAYVSERNVQVSVGSSLTSTTSTQQSTNTTATNITSSTTITTTTTTAPTTTSNEGASLGSLGGSETLIIAGAVVLIVIIAAVLVLRSRGRRSGI